MDQTPGSFRYSYQHSHQWSLPHDLANRASAPGGSRLPPRPRLHCALLPATPEPKGPVRHHRFGGVLSHLYLRQTLTRL